MSLISDHPTVTPFAHRDYAWHVRRQASYCWASDSSPGHCHLASIGWAYQRTKLLAAFLN